MPDFGQELSDLDFDNIIGGPLSAVIQAQATSAMTTMQFIQEIGLEVDQGQIRPVMARFEYFKQGQNDDGALEEMRHTLNVPVLSIVPIPYISFDDLFIDFNAKLNSVERRTFDAVNRTLVKSKGKLFGMKFKGRFARKRHSKGVGTVEKTYNMNVKVHAVRDEMPEGMERVMNILEQMSTSVVRPYNAAKSVTFKSGSAIGFEQNQISTGHGRAKQIKVLSNGQGYHTSKQHIVSLAPNTDLAQAEAPRIESIRDLQIALNKLVDPTSTSGEKLVTHGDGPNGALVTDNVYGQNTSTALKMFYDKFSLQPPCFEPDVITDPADNISNAQAFTPQGNGILESETGWDDLMDALYAELQKLKAFRHASIQLTTESNSEQTLAQILDGGEGYQPGTDLKVNVQINGIDVMLTVDVDGSGTVSKVSVDDDSQLRGALPPETFYGVSAETNGMGVGYVADVTINPDGSIDIVPSNKGANFEKGDKLFFDNRDLGGVGSGFEAEVTDTDGNDQMLDTHYICVGTSGSGEDLRVRLLQSGSDPTSWSVDAVLDGGRDYSIGEVNVSHVDGPGTATVNITQVG